ncbi:hypothetical protein IHV25_02320 [Phaeovibrio sulfidiphilus]|uniref:Hydrogenase expression/formation protein HupK n=1 Tax=Phaeovibrio sulfidiphilus TaxID=1220600 RepID=A0A8J6YXK2_9PROT|nr:hypothetical protein [Phaeovibrio sulfidiphilus]MBE1236488.1 hypothetical protein [Phaeovibrio sulfidiphilus]
MTQPPLVVRARYEGGCVSDISVTNSRPVVARLLSGCDAEGVPDLVGSLFVPCRNAHMAAASFAISAFRREVANIPDGIWLRLHVELFNETLHRLLISWPEVLGHPRMTETYAHLYRAAARTDMPSLMKQVGTPEVCALYESAPVDGSVFADRIAQLDAPWNLLADLMALEREQPPAGSAADLSFIPDGADAGRDAPGWLEESLCLCPTVPGTRIRPDSPAETGAFSRHSNKPLVLWLRKENLPLSARFACLVLDLHDWLRGLRDPQMDRFSGTVMPLNDEGVGLCRVETQRGALIHAVQLDDQGQVSRYGICAPTEWNFHPRGILRREALRLCGSPDNVEARLRALVLALDPCVEHSVVLEAA